MLQAIMLALVFAVLAPPPDLASDQHARLATAHDGRGHDEEAFMALLEHVAAWDESAAHAWLNEHPSTKAPRPVPDVLLADAESARGMFFIVAGRIEQITDLPAPWSGVVEWFVRDDSGTPLIVYVRTATLGSNAVRTGMQVEVPARFYKRINFIARDNQEHAYPAFVGAWPSVWTGAGTPITPGTSRRPSVAPSAGTSTAWIVGVILILGIGFLVLLRRVRLQRDSSRQRRLEKRRRTWQDAEDDSDADPSDALAALRRETDRE